MNVYGSSRSEKVDCPTCGVDAGEQCQMLRIPEIKRFPHGSRVEKARTQDADEEGDDGPITDGGTLDSGVERARGTLILADEFGRPLQWHHSVEFDGYTHTTACGREIDPSDDVREVLMDDPVDDWSANVKPANSCAACHRSVRALRVRDNPGTEKIKLDCPHCGETHEVEVVTEPGWERMIFCPRLGVV